ncbi:MAG: sugar ABC transporter permease [Spirochaetaceae bacterium]|jgi:arabinogalactan oligomer/maltooligosaccharide transport system permease protein|nr:sugar ABC transporter permease [Spirochaetaceae bacterium]
MKYIAALYSAVVWGSGQFLNKQKLKGVIFFALQVGCISCELFTAPFWRNIARAAAADGAFAALGGAGAVEKCRFFFARLGEQLADIHNWGFFVKGVWGLVTLGSVPRVHGAEVYDHSIMLMLGGIIAVLVLALFAAVWIFNIRDAYKTRVQIENGVRLSSIDWFRHLWRSSFEYIMIAPGILLVIFISIIPIVFAILVAFTNYNANFIPPRRLVEWTGFETFARIAGIKIWGGTFVRIFAWTVAWAFLATFTSYIFGMVQACILRSKLVKWPSAWRAIFILPWAVPGLVSMLVFKVLLNKEGAINQMLLKCGAIQEAIPFLSDVFWARLCLVAVNVWLGFPYFMVLIGGVMATIPADLYEAAALDGARPFKRFTAITLPFTLASTAPQILMSVTFNFNNFNLIYFLTGGGPANPAFQMAGSTDILISWIFKLTLDQRMYNYASALSIFIFVIVASVSAWNLLRTRAFKEQ